jgi:hypothetical protein
MSSIGLLELEKTLAFHFDKSMIGEFQRRRKKSYEPHLDSKRSAASDQQQQ